MRRSLAFALLLLTWLEACAGSRQYFEPTERVHGETLYGYRKAMYALVGPSGQFGQAKLWSRGAYRYQDRTVVQIGMELHNTSAAPFELRAADVWLEPVRVGDGIVASVRPAEVNDVVFAPQALGPASFHFVMPPGIAPTDVIGFRLHWQVRSGDLVYSENTPFRRELSADEYAPGPYGYAYGYAYCPAFDPFCFEAVPYGHVVVRPRHTLPARHRSRVIVRPRR